MYIFTLQVFLAETVKLLIAVHFQIFFIKNANMMSSIRKGVEWLKENHQLMKSKYLPPQIVCMEEEDALNALARLRTHRDTILDEDDEIRAPFYFTFKNREDMLFFMSEVRDNNNFRVSSFYNPDI